MKHSAADTNSTEVVATLTDIQVQTALMAQQKLTRRALVAEQRGMMRQLAADQQREYQSKVHAAHSAATTTAKIRDYHRINM
jgi:hypothetical protein